MKQLDEQRVREIVREVIREELAELKKSIQPVVLNMLSESVNADAFAAERFRARLIPEKPWN